VENNSTGNDRPARQPPSPPGRKAGWGDVLSARSKSFWYVAAIVLVTLVAWLRKLADPLLGDLARYLPFTLVIVVCTYGGGLGPGALSLALSAVIGTYLFVDHPVMKGDVVNLTIFIAQAAGITFLTAALRKVRDSAQAAAGRAQAAMRQKDQVVVRVSHEWRAPLNVLAGWVTQLQSRPNDADFVSRAAANMMRAVETQKRLVEDLLDYSRGARGRLSIHPVRLLIATPVDTSLDAVRNDAAAKKIDIVMEVDPALRVWGDNQRLQQVFTNLLTNAIKFTPEFGRITVKSRRIGDTVEVEVQDTGVGIDSHLLKDVFEPFAQAHPTRDTALGGLGLGLSISREIVLLHAGTIEASSPGPGRGSTFKVRLPVSAAPAAASERDAAPHQRA
jgi:signal transduction histidine kinase